MRLHWRLHSLVLWLLARPRGGPLQGSEGARNTVPVGALHLPQGPQARLPGGLVAPAAVGVARVHTGVWGCVALREVRVRVPHVYLLRSPCTVTSGHLGSTPAPLDPASPHLRSTGLRGPPAAEGPACCWPALTLPRAAGRAGLTGGESLGRGVWRVGGSVEDRRGPLRWPRLLHVPAQRRCSWGFWAGGQARHPLSESSTLLPIG